MRLLLVKSQKNKRKSFQHLVSTGKIYIVTNFDPIQVIENKLLYYAISIVTILISTSILTLLEKFKLDKKAHNAGS